MRPQKKKMMILWMLVLLMILKVGLAVPTSYIV